MPNCIGTYNFDCFIQNSGFELDMTFTQGTDTVTPIDLTQFAKIQMDVLDDYQNLIFSLSLGSGLSVIGTDDNVLSIQFTGDQTELMTRSLYNYDILMQTSSGYNVYLIGGKIRPIRTQTRITT